MKNSEVLRIQGELLHDIDKLVKKRVVLKIKNQQYWESKVMRGVN